MAQDGAMTCPGVFMVGDAGYLLTCFTIMGDVGKSVKLFFNILNL